MPYNLNSLPQPLAQVLSNPTWDIVLVLAFLGAGFFYGISSGKQRISATILYTYVAWAIFQALPLDQWFKDLGGGEEFFAKAGVFLAIFLLLAFLLGSRRKGIASAFSWWQIFLLSFLQIGLVIHLLLNIIPLKLIGELAPLTRTLFANPDLHTWWLILPLAAVILLKRFD